MSVKDVRNYLEVEIMVMKSLDADRWVHAYDGEMVGDEVARELRRKHVRFCEHVLELLEKEGDSPVVELPVTPGADLWWVNEETDELEVCCEEGGVKAVAVFEDGHCEIVSENGLEKINDGYAWLTRELAEQHRAELLEG